MGSIGVDGMMRHDRKKGSRAGALELSFEPGKLFCLLLRGQGKIPAEKLLVARTGHIAVERQKRNQRIFRGKLKAIPTGGHRPTGRGAAISSAARVFQLGIDFALRPPLIIVVPQHRISRARKVVNRVHLLELCLPPGGVDAPALIPRTSCLPGGAAPGGEPNAVWNRPAGPRLPAIVL